LGGQIGNKHFANKINNITTRKEIKLSIPIFYIYSNYKLTEFGVNILGKINLEGKVGNEI